jgi:hypothetical protein
MRNHRWSDRRALVLAAAQLVAFALILRSRGFAAMRSWVAASNVTPPPALRHHDDAVVRTLRAVDRACMYSPVGMRCLARAAIATRLLRAKGFPAAMVIGVHRMPFTAHAWVEMHGAPLYGFIDGERNTTFRVIDRV